MLTLLRLLIQSTVPPKGPDRKHVAVCSVCNAAGAIEYAGDPFLWPVCTEPTVVSNVVCGEWMNEELSEPADGRFLPPEGNCRARRKSTPRRRAMVSVQPAAINPSSAQEVCTTADPSCQQPTIASVGAKLATFQCCSVTLDDTLQVRCGSS